MEGEKCQRFREGGATRSSLREESIELGRGDPHQVLEGVDLSSMPAIQGFVQTGRRVMADTALVTPDERPVLASWRYGLGTVAAWTTDAGQRWTSDWSNWEPTGQLMRQLVRFAIRRHGGHGVESQVTLRDNNVEIVVKAPEGDATEPPAIVELTAHSARGSASDVPMTFERTAPWRMVDFDGRVHAMRNRALPQDEDSPEPVRRLSSALGRS